MIFSRLDANGAPAACPAAIRRALDYLRGTDVLALPLGRHELEGDGMYLNVMDMTTRPFAGSHPEVHRKYIDLMYWPEGGEKLGFAPFRGTEPVFRADPEGDVWLLETVEHENILTMTAGCFGVFFPWDAHRPGLMLGETPATSRKCVVKIGMELL